MNLQTLKLAHRTIGEEVKRLYHEGKVPNFMPVSGQVALLWDKLNRWFDTKDNDELLDFAALGVFLVAKSLNIKELEKEMIPIESTSLISNEELDAAVTEEVRDSFDTGNQKRENETS